jgi:RNA polymerase sigma-54 factor
MALLQPNLSLKVTQRQVLTPGLMQMVSVLALNKLELKEMIDAEMVENPVLEEIDETVPMLDEVAGREKRLERGVEEPPAPPKDPFQEVDFGSYFQDYLDPGYRTQPEYEESDKPSFENFLSQPTTLSDHLAWQLGVLTLQPELREAAEFVIGNLDEDGYLAAGEEELATAFIHSPEEQLPENQSVAGLSASNGEDAELAAALDLLRRGIDQVQHLDPAGVGAEICASAFCSRSRPSSRSSAICTPGRQPSWIIWTRIPIAASAPRPRSGLRSGGAAWKSRR